jgi:hypothetical protein
MAPLLDRLLVIRIIRGRHVEAKKRDQRKEHGAFARH